MTTALNRDPADAVSDAELLAMVLKHRRAEQVAKDAMAGIEANRNAEGAI